MSNSFYGKIVSFAHERIAYKVTQLNMIEKKKHRVKKENSLTVVDFTNTR